jgi:phosphomannomutase / phosphoglucomutase
MLVQSFSGIRGVYGNDLTDDIARRYAFVFNEFLKKKLGKEPLIVVGMDTRNSGDALKNSLYDALFNIIDVGVMPVACVELGVREFKADGGIMITASHNEPEFNGFKFLDKDGAVLRPKDIDVVINSFKEISKLSEEEFLDRLPKANLEERRKPFDKYLYKEELKNKVKRIDKKGKELISKYCNFLTKIVGKIDNKVKVVLDVNGGSGIVLKEIVSKLGLKNLEIINDKAGEFKRKIEPTSESLKYLKGKLTNAEFGAGFDCDADRVEILLKDGKVVDGNYLLALIVDSVLKKSKGTVVTNDATSKVVTRVVEKHDCEVKEVEVGEINVVDEMLRLKSPIGGEGSNGGVIFPPSRCRDGILSILYLLKIISDNDKSLGELIKELPKYYTIQKKIKSDKPIDKEKIKTYYSKFIIQETGGVTGGLKVIIDKNNFVWFRASKTESNLIRIIADSDSEKKCKRLLAEAGSLF